MSPPIRRLAAAMGVALMLAACGRTQLDLPATLPAEPVRVTASANGFEGEITIDGGIVAVPRLHELIEPRMRGLLAETQVMSQINAEARGAASAEGLFFKAEWTSSPAGRRYLNVRGLISQFAGGAHPLTVYDAFVWDRLGQRRLALADLLRDPRPGSEAVTALAAAARDALIEVKRSRIPDYAPEADSFIAAEGDGPFVPDLLRFAQNFQLVPADDLGEGGGIELLFSPYDVGPYAEGRFEVLVPGAAVASFLKADAARLLAPLD
ncbi:MAG TPA: RsiV family protein [Steroidobacteraceae bacterium]|jgi:hypothetical protein|nr:RsiV family protein [Steroidobacteraceae bacterium]HNS28542.1 RsiV family protein [Steroidobacteraceae bacterium]